MIRSLITSIVLFITLSINAQTKPIPMPVLKVSPNGRFLMTEKGEPFFWLGDTGWLMPKKLNRNDIALYFDDRIAKGFNVVQIMAVHKLDDKNLYGDPAFMENRLGYPYVTNGNKFAAHVQYDYWDNLEYIVDYAATKNVYVAIVPVWGDNIKKGNVSVGEARLYASLLAKRFKNRTNVIWLLGGDVDGERDAAVWKAMGETFKEICKNQLVTYHPRGRMQSSTWFHNEKWLDFNMFQSGHKSYAQDSIMGEDNWKYVQADYALTPSKPTLDAEPSYEGIPHGLHDSLAPRWTAWDVRRYAYWSVFAGAFGHTYGHNSVMQFYAKGDTECAFFADVFWKPALAAEGAAQLKHLKNLVLSRPFFDRIPDQSLLVNNFGSKYDYVIATRGKDYVFVYTCNGSSFVLNLEVISGKQIKAQWFNPRTGVWSDEQKLANEGTREFDPPGNKENGNDWVLVLDGEKNSDSSIKK